MNGPANLQKGWTRPWAEAQSWQGRRASFSVGVRVLAEVIAPGGPPKAKAHTGDVVASVGRAITNLSVWKGV